MPHHLSALPSRQLGALGRLHGAKSALQLGQLLAARLDPAP
jgi:hypothetical protein